MRKGIVVFEHPETGRLHAEEIDLPINTNMHIVAWALDMCRKINEHSRFRRFLLQLVLGRHAWRELIGLKDAVDKDWDVTIDYGIEGCEYHNDKVKW